MPNKRVRIVPDQLSYHPGDTAQVFIPNPFGTAVPALLTVERGKVLRYQLFSLWLKADTQRSAMARERSTLSQELTEYESRRTSVVTAPTDGTATAVLAELGQAAQPAQPLVSILPGDAELRAHLIVPSQSIGFLAVDQTVALRYQAFPYQRFGVKNGIVSWSSPAGAPGEKELTFRAFAQLVETRVRVDGEDRPFLPGMKGSALLVVGRRSVISYAFDPLRQMREALR